MWGGEADLAGWGGWSRRFVLDGAKLSYYVESGEQKGSIRLSDVKEVKEAEQDTEGVLRYCFEVHTEKRVFVMVAEKEVDMRSWVSAINTNLKLLRHL